MSRTTAVLARMDLGRFAKEQAAHRLARVAFDVRKTLRASPSSAAIVDAIHDLRVSTRRLRAVLDTFADFFPPAEERRVVKDLRAVFKLAGNVRNIDITLELIEESGKEGVEPLCAGLRQERSEHIIRLMESLRSWVRRDFSARWRESLSLP